MRRRHRFRLNDETLGAIGLLVGGALSALFVYAVGTQVVVRLIP